MARQKRIAAEGFKGVFLVASVSPASGEPDHIIYIRYKRDGKLYEDKVGRTSEKAPKPNHKKYWSPFLASLVRADKIRGRAPTNSEIRAAEQAAKESESGRWTISKLWKEYRANNEDKARIAITDDYRFSMYIDPAFGSKTPSEIDPLSVDRLRVKMSKTRKPATVHNTLELLRRIINFGVNRNLCPPLPFKLELPKLNNHRTEDLTPDQLQDLLDAIEKDKHPVAGPMMLCALYTGMRRGEMFKLEWSDLDFDRGFIRLRDPKGGKDQTIPMNAQARKLLESMPKVCQFVFAGRPDKNGNYAPRTRIADQVNKIKKAAGLPKDFRALHGLRHVYASMLASSGKVDMYTLQKLMTHKSADMTQRYAHLRDESLTRAGQVVDDIFNGLAEEQNKVVSINGK
ncbi:integrase [Desulfomicrobium macestii]|uniref:Integrase n=1 Tax=Desulfomicrobium macestii TaxID=90731 RepID=A0ABR9H7U0_9BACT|nr:site-specific integrase [Desulfomicrobium macestii]MBE1426787.1 integrase [Desulfomicrobium macestii]